MSIQVILPKFSNKIEINWEIGIMQKSKNRMWIENELFEQIKNNPVGQLYLVKKKFLFMCWEII